MITVRPVVVTATWYVAMAAPDLSILNAWIPQWWKARFLTNGFAINANTKSTPVKERAHLTVLTLFWKALKAKTRVHSTCPGIFASTLKVSRPVQRENTRKLFLQSQSKNQPCFTNSI